MVLYCMDEVGDYFASHEAFLVLGVEGEIGEEAAALAMNHYIFSLFEFLEHELNGLAIDQSSVRFEELAHMAERTGGVEIGLFVLALGEEGDGLDEVLIHKLAMVVSVLEQVHERGCYFPLEIGSLACLPSACAHFQPVQTLQESYVQIKTSEPRVVLDIEGKSAHYF